MIDRESLVRKYRTARDVFAQRGFNGLLAIGLEKCGRCWRPVRRWWNRNNHWWVGLVVEVMGNRVTVDGLQFDVSDPLISREIKSRLFLGRYEKPEREAVRDHLITDLPVIELGAGIGVVSCLINKKLSNPRRHVAVEANTLVCRLLEKNRTLNGCKFTIRNAAIHYRGEMVPFPVDISFLDGRVDANAKRTVRVPAVTLSELADEFEFDRFTLVCDIEGMETELVRHEQDVLASRASMIILETHEALVGKDAHQDMLQILLSVFDIIDRPSKKVYVLRNRLTRDENLKSEKLKKPNF